MKTANILYAMILLRVISSMIEMSAAYLMYYFRDIETAIRINAILGLVGPTILILVTFLGLVGISHELNLQKIFLIAIGVIFILLGTH